MFIFSGMRHDSLFLAMCTAVVIAISEGSEDANLEKYLMGSCGRWEYLQLECGQHSKGL